MTDAEKTGLLELYAQIRRYCDWVDGLLQYSERLTTDFGVLLDGLAAGQTPQMSYVVEQRADVLRYLGTLGQQRGDLKKFGDALMQQGRTL